jgi:hypothetical protein
MSRRREPGLHPDAHDDRPSNINAIRLERMMSRIHSDASLDRVVLQADAE